MARRERLVALALNPRGDGAWAVDRKGNVFAFGMAPEFREVPEPQPWRGGPWWRLLPLQVVRECGYLTAKETSSRSAMLRNFRE